MAVENVYMVLSPSPQGEGKEHIERCPDCGTFLINTDRQYLIEHALSVGLTTDWYLVRFVRAETFDVRASLTAAQGATK